MHKWRFSLDFSRLGQLALKMLCLAVVLLLSSLRLVALDVISNRYCPDMRPQVYVTIEQLLGMWYGVELINHKLNQERLGIQYVDSCPIIHISEDHSPTVTPFIKGGVHYPYGTSYGSTQQDGSSDTNQDTYYSQYGRSSYKGSASYQGRNYSPDDYLRRYADDIKRLRLLWTDNGSQVEYTLRYNVSKPGFWISSGPQNGSALEPPYNQFAGTVQIIKAVGNHLVLTFCHQLPDQQLYTVILSRIPKLTRHELSDVHDLLTRRALETNNIKRVCSQSSSAAATFSSGLLVVGALATLSKASRC